MIQEIIDFILDIVLWVPRFIYSLLADLLEYFLSQLPTPTGEPVSNPFGGLGADMLYFLNYIELSYGLTVIFGALIARFILRRIPIIG